MKTYFLVHICDNDSEEIIKTLEFRQFAPAFEKYVELIRKGMKAKFRHKVTNQ